MPVSPVNDEEPGLGSTPPVRQTATTGSSLKRAAQPRSPKGENTPQGVLIHPWLADEQLAASLPPEHPRQFSRSLCLSPLTNFSAAIPIEPDPFIGIDLIIADTGYKLYAV